MYDQCVHRDTWQQFHGGHVPGLKSQEAISTKQTSDFSLNYFEPYFAITSVGSGHEFSISHGENKVIAVKLIQGQASCWGEPTQWATPPKPETFTPNPGFSGIIQLHYPPRNNDKETSAGLVGPAGEPVVLPALPALSKTSKCSSFQPQHNKAILYNRGTDFCEISLMMLPAISK